MKKTSTWKLTTAAAVLTCAAAYTPALADVWDVDSPQAQQHEACGSHAATVGAECMASGSNLPWQLLMLFCNSDANAAYTSCMSSRPITEGPRPRTRAVRTGARQRSPDAAQRPGTNPLSRQEPRNRRLPRVLELR